MQSKFRSTYISIGISQQVEIGKSDDYGNFVRQFPWIKTEDVKNRTGNSYVVQHMTQNMADDVNMPENHVNGFEETPGEREDQNEADETEETVIEDEENLEELVENASNGEL